MAFDDLLMERGDCYAGFCAPCLASLSASFVTCDVCVGSNFFDETLYVRFIMTAISSEVCPKGYFRTRGDGCEFVGGICC